MSEKRRMADLADHWQGPGMPRLLLVDDDEMTRRASRRFLTRVGFDVLTVDSGAAALDCLGGETRVDAVITDFDMPGMNGVELLRVIHARDPGLPKGIWSASPVLRELDTSDLELAWFVVDKMRPFADLVQAVCSAIHGQRTWFEQTSATDSSPPKSRRRGCERLASGWHRRDEVMEKAAEARAALNRESSSR